MSIKSKLEALIYAAEEPIGVDQMAALLRHDLLELQNQPAQSNTDDPDSHLGAVEVTGSEEAPSSAEPFENSQAESSQNIQPGAGQDVPEAGSHAVETPKLSTKKT